MAAVVELRGVTKEFAGERAVNELSQSLSLGEVLCLLGENGAGKSTVIKLLTGVQAPTRGEIFVDGKQVHFGSPREAREHGIACVYQEVGTFPLMSVARNFVVGAEPVKGRWPFRRIDMNKASDMAISELRKLGIRQVTDGHRLVGSLSGGERQALAIGRAIHFGARVLVLDEPTAALGVRESAGVLRLIKAARAHGVAVLFITHNAYHAMETGDRFVVLRHGEALATFSRGEMGIEELLSLMAGGDELRELMTAEDGPDGLGAQAGMP
jgi:simple sugar transport system ATP-binding protein